MSVEPEQVPKLRGHSKSHVLPDSIGQSVEAGFDPVVGAFLTTGGTESGLTGMGSFDRLVTRSTDKEVVSQKVSSADEELENVGDDTGTDQRVVFEEKPPPVAIVQKDVSKGGFQRRIP